jgi:hypothetical protein
MSYRKPLFVVLASFVSCSWVVAQDAPAPPRESPPPDQTESVPQIDTVANQRVKAMSEFLAKQQKFRFNVEITYDAVEPDGQKVQLGRRSIVEVMRPNGLRGETKGDRGSHMLSAFDGKNFLVHDQAHNVYSRVETPATMEEFFDFIFEKYGVSPPLTDFLLKDVHGALTKNAESGALLGDAFVAEEECDHVVFEGENLDWQIWIEKGDQPWPRKFVITYKDVEVRPQFMATFRQWEAGVPLEAARFDTSTPSGASEVPMQRFTDDDSSKEGAKSDTPAVSNETPEGE